MAVAAAEAAEAAEAAAIRLGHLDCVALMLRPGGLPDIAQHLMSSLCLNEYRTSPFWRPRTVSMGADDLRTNTAVDDFLVSSLSSNLSLSATCSGPVSDAKSPSSSTVIMGSAPATAGLTLGGCVEW